MMRETLKRFALLVALIAFCSTGLAETRLFCYPYNTRDTRMNAYPGHSEKYQFPVLMKNIKQVWNGYCPKCTLPNKTLCRKLPCQKYNLKIGTAYNGIEVAGDPWMKLANEAALRSVQHGGGPFGAVIVQIDDKTGRVIRYWVNHNHVVSWDDPTAHAEISTIRAAAHQLGVTNLGHIRKEDSKLPQPSEWSHCVVYSSDEPCPMCMGAIYWAGIHYLVFSATRYDAAMPGANFSDKIIYQELDRPYAKRKYIKVRQASTDNSLDAFNYYKRTPVARYGVAPK